MSTATMPPWATLGRFALVVPAVLLCACGNAPDAQSGGDQRRDVAAELPLDQWVTDEDGVDHGQGDRTDWKRLVAPRRGTLFVQLAFDERDVAAVATVYDRYGRKLAEKTKDRGRTDHLVFEQEVEPGKYFVRIAAKRSEDRSIYSIRASMQGGAALGDIPPPE